MAPHPGRVAAATALLGLIVSGCASEAPTTGTFAHSSDLVGKLPTPTASPNAFIAGLATTETLSGGQRVKLMAGGPALANPVKGQPVQFAPNLLETFTITAEVVSGGAVTFTPADFTIHRAVGGDAPVGGPARVVVSPRTSRTWAVTTLQTPGQGELVWHDGTTAVAKWSYVAEND